ncbi:protein pleiotropic regulatory locus 1 [Cocos nucifera]|uniref:Protein pleiotropic regulatory locus 1 n=1 Tax=Cocos nucifera TaxID=13894 RepID=A0A8K0I6C4_COCNU|nr:protein pleiotropic regulatory locus 1 [Cocos nucifera]
MRRREGAGVQSESVFVEGEGSCGGTARGWGNIGGHGEVSKFIPTGSQDSRDSKKEGSQSAIVAAPTMQPKGPEPAIPNRNAGAVVSVTGSSERYQSTSALMERIPSRWPRPTWHPPWKNYRVWDIRTKAMIFALSGHDNTVCSVFARPTDPQVVTGSHDTTIKFWDLAAGKSMATLTHHKKSVRAMALHPKEQSFTSASADNIKKFSLPRGEFLHNMLSQQKTIINSMAVNEDGVLATAGDNGSLWLWDWKSGHNFQQAQTIVQPGSLDSEACIYALSYDISGSRLVTCEADKTIKMSQQKTIINSMAVNEDGVLATAGDNGSLWLWDWKSGHNFQQAQTIVQPGSLDSEACIYALSYDISGSRLVTCEADKTIKMWKEDPTATPETHPLNFKPPKEFRRY